MRKLTRYKEEEFKEVIKNSKSITDVCRGLNIGTKGSNHKTIVRYIEFFSADISHFKSKEEQLKELHFTNKFSLQDILVQNSSYTNNFNLKKRLLSGGLLKNKCQSCNLEGFWNGKNLNMQLDHINGINNDNRIENLRMLCPNCHSQTDTFCGKQKGKNSILKKQREINGGRTDKEISSNKNKRKVERPTEEVLVKLIKEHGFSGTGKIYGLNGNSIKKWCLSYGISSYIKDYK